MGKFELVDAICQSNFLRVRSSLKLKKPVHVREMGIHLHSTAIMIYPYSCFQFFEDEISRNTTKNCPRRLTAEDPLVQKMETGFGRQEALRTSCLIG